MSYLLYSVFETLSISFPTISGVGEQPIKFFKKNGLTAVVSNVFGSEPPLSIDQLKIYQGVIETLFKNICLIPMRYGCLFDSQDAVLQMLEESGQDYRDRLKEIEGCAEMGIRIICPIEENETKPIQPVQIRSEKRLTGAAYLSSRRNHYDKEDEKLHLDDRLVETYTAPFKLLFTRHCSEKKQKGNTKNLAVFFLVPRERINAFKARYREIAKEAPGKSYLSGPWPPYNFVMSVSNPLFKNLLVS